MLNQLIESKNHREENARKNGFLMTTLGVLAAVLLSGWTYSLFAKNFGMGAGDFEFSSLVAPVAVADDAPPPKPEPKTEKTQSKESNKIILKDLYSDISTIRIPPKDLNGVKDVVSAEKYNFDDIQIGKENLIPENVGRNAPSDDPGCGLCPNDDENKPNKEEKEPELVVKSSPKPPVEQKPQRPVTGGVMNGKATYLAKPPYPPAARALRITDSVSVQVLIDETGKVVSASAISGNPILRTVSENAARQSKFSPTYLSNQPVKVTGVIIYKFVP
jgi:hypothetical protein